MFATCYPTAGMQERLADMLGSKLYNSIRDQAPDHLAKVVAVEGDVSKAGCGLDPTTLAHLHVSGRPLLDQSALAINHCVFSHQMLSAESHR
jgi:hypothetical protein